MPDHADSTPHLPLAGKQATTPAQRALAEAEERRKRLDAAQKLRPREHKGRKGPDPARYGDWETKGIASDF